MVLSFSRYMGLFFYGLVMSSIIGLVSFIFIMTESTVVNVIWETVPTYFQYKSVAFLVICLVGGLLVGGIRKRWGDIPKTAHDTFSELKANQTIDNKMVFQSMLSAIVILIFGAGVGPEATLLSAILSLSVWQANKTRDYYFNYVEFSELTTSGKIKRLFNPVSHHLCYDENRAVTGKRKQEKNLLAVLFILNGIFTFIILMKISGQPSFISKLGQSQWVYTELWLVIPVLGFSLVYKKMYQFIEKLIKNLLSSIKQSVVILSLVGSASIFLIATLFPNLLFSGQHSMALLPIRGVSESALFLTLLAILKLVFLLVCLNTGWVGGNIFPVFLASVIQGFGIAQLFPAHDTLFIVAIVSTSISIAILDSPVVGGIFSALFFPINLIPVVLVIAGLFFIIGKVKARRSESSHLSKQLMN